LKPMQKLCTLFVAESDAAVLVLAYYRFCYGTMS
jgi:hypothetical protein